MSEPPVASRLSLCFRNEAALRAVQGSANGAL